MTESNWLKDYEIAPGSGGYAVRRRAPSSGQAFLSPGRPADRSIARDHLLKVSEAAELLSVSKDYLYKNAKRLPFTVKVGSALRFSYLGIQHYSGARRGLS